MDVFSSLPRFRALTTIFRSIILAPFPLYAGILELGVSQAYTSGAGSEGRIHKLSYRPEKGTTAIVVLVATESSGKPGKVRFGQNDLIPVVEAEKSNVGVYYLNNPGTEQASDLVFDYTECTTLNFIAFQAISLRAAGEIRATASATGNIDRLLLQVPDNNSLVVSGFNFNEGGKPVEIAADGLMITTFGGQIHSGGAAFAYQNMVAAGDFTCSFRFSKIEDRSARKLTSVAFHDRPG